MRHILAFLLIPLPLFADSYAEQSLRNQQQVIQILQQEQFDRAMGELISRRDDYIDSAIEIERSKAQIESAKEIEDMLREKICPVYHKLNEKSLATLQGVIDREKENPYFSFPCH